MESSRMSTLQAGTGLEGYGIHTSKPVHVNLPAPVLYEHAIRRNEGLVAADGPLVCRTGAHTGRSPNDKFVVQEPSSEAHIWWGKVNRPMRPAHYDALARATCWPTSVSKELYVQDLYAGADPDLPPVGALRPGICLAQPVRPEPVHRAAHRAIWRASQAAVHRPDGAVLQGRSGQARHAVRRRHCPQHGGARSDHRRHQLRRREQEVDLHRAELRAAAAGRARHALLGQHRRRLATRRSSSACRAPARRRSRAIRSAG